MSEIQSLITQPCTLLIREGDDEEEFGVRGGAEIRISTLCYLEQKSREEAGGEGEAGVSDWLAIFRADEDVDTASGLVVNGQVYEFVGAPWRVWDPERNRYAHIEATVRYTGTEEGS